jgi:ectoine hydroxylase-related dioxygenase (phytanoyl-CoA dioxygenase family)
MSANNDYFSALKKDGYVCIPDVLTKKECTNYKMLLDEVHEKYSPLYSSNAPAKHRLNFHEDEKIAYNIHNKHESFLRFIDLPDIFELVEKYLQQGSYNNMDPVILRQLTARSPCYEKGYQQLHIDSRIPGLRYPLMAVVTVMIDEFTLENGATRVVPESHKFDCYPKDNQLHPQEKVISGKPGSVCIMDGSTWHAGGQNKTQSTRWGVLLTYVRWFYKPAFDFNKNMPKDLFNLLTTQQKKIMGYTSNPPIDEFTRISARTDDPEIPYAYKLPKKF